MSGVLSPGGEKGSEKKGQRHPLPRDQLSPGRRRGQHVFLVEREALVSCGKAGGGQEAVKESCGHSRLREPGHARL